MFVEFVEGWYPSDAEYARYLKREAELAKANIELLRRRFGRASWEDTLHSSATFEAASR